MGLENAEHLAVSSAWGMGWAGMAVFRVLIVEDFADLAETMADALRARAHRRDSPYPCCHP